ncbi:MAG: DMT family transporter [Sphaerochaetaceae bacterium]|nr:DMT family transporter [Sphaerochaetaceae bacterium]
MNSGLLIGQALALLTSMFLAENSIIFSFLGKNVGSDSVVHLRLWIATPVIIILAFVFEGNFLLLLTPSTLISLLLSGFIGYFVCDSLLFWAFVNWGPRETMVVMTLNPVFTSIFSYLFFKEYLTILQIFAICLTIMGIIVLILGDKKSIKTSKDKNRIKGILFAFLGSILQAISLILAKSALFEVGPMGSNTIRCIGGFFAVMIYSLFFRKQFSFDFHQFANKKYLSLLVIASLTGPVLGMTMQMFAFNLAPIGLVSAIVQINPLFILLFDWLYLKKTLSLWAVMGTFISVIGVVLMFI